VRIHPGEGPEKEGRKFAITESIIGSPPETRGRSIIPISLFIILRYAIGIFCGPQPAARKISLLIAMQATAMPPRKDTPKLVRRIWSEFETWAAEQRAKLEDESKKVEAKWRSTSMWPRQKGNNDAQKAKEIRTAQEKYLSAVREEWDRRLKAHKLKDTDWGPMTPQELDRVFIVLGGDLDEPSPIIEKTPEKIVQQPSQPPQRVQPHTPVASTALVLASATAPPPPAPAPSFSSTARASNASSTSTSSYSFVSPSDFTTDDELYEAVSSYIIVSRSSFS
jgi:hypothetical protein